jgi:hypothetical protein
MWAGTCRRWSASCRGGTGGRSPSMRGDRTPWQSARSMKPGRRSPAGPRQESSASTWGARAKAAQVPFAWVADDEVYGDNAPLRTWLEAQHIPYVLAAACGHRVPAGSGHAIRADQLAVRLPRLPRLPRRAWRRLSAGNDAEGHRWYDWAWITITWRPRSSWPPKTAARSDRNTDRSARDGRRVVKSGLSRCRGCQRRRPGCRCP